MGWPPGRGEACWDAPDPTSPQSAGQSQQAGTCPLGADKIPWEAVCGAGGGEHAVKLTRKLGGTGWSPWKATSMAIAEFMGKPAGTPSKFPGSYPLSLPGNRLG